MSLLSDVSLSKVGILIVNGIFAVPTVEVLVFFDVIYTLLFQYIDLHRSGHAPTSFHYELKLISLIISDHAIIPSYFLTHICQS